jgi:OFA family oxalate/formate antiporter-like MFS transporter
LFFHIFSRTIYYTLSSSFVVAHAPDQAHRHAALIPVLTGLFVVALISISLVKYLGDRNVTKAVEDRG